MCSIINESLLRIALGTGKTVMNKADNPSSHGTYVQMWHECTAWTFRAEIQLVSVPLVYRKHLTLSESTYLFPAFPPLEAKLDECRNFAHFVHFCSPSTSHSACSHSMNICWISKQFGYKSYKAYPVTWQRYKVVNAEVSNELREL